MKVRYTPQAFSEREHIFEYLEDHSPMGAHRVMFEIKSATIRLCQNPLSGYTADETGVRVKILTHYPYKIFYRVAVSDIEILHIRHSARQSLT